MKGGGIREIGEGEGGELREKEREVMRKGRSKGGIFRPGL